MLPVPGHGRGAQQRQASEPNSSTTVPGTVVDAATFVADQHPRLVKVSLMPLWPLVMTLLCSLQCGWRRSCACEWHSSELKLPEPNCVMPLGLRPVLAAGVVPIEQFVFILSQSLWSASSCAG